MLDHVGFPITDYQRSKAFYEKALAPLGYSLVMEVPQVGSSRVDLQACKLEYSIVSPK